MMIFRPSNLLINWEGELLIGDFGQARPLCSNILEIKIGQEINDNLPQETELETNNLLSHQVCTRWYRAPELLYGSNNYDFSIDMWSFGCIVAELYQNKPLFSGESDIEQLGIVTSALGEPPFFWAQRMPDFNKIIFNQKTNQKGTSWLDKLKQILIEKGQKNESDKNDKQENKFNDLKINETVIDLIQKVIRYTERRTARDLFDNHKLFDEIRAVGLKRDKLKKCKKIKQMSGPKRK